MKYLSLLVLVTVSMLYGSEMAYAADSDGNGVSDIVEASTGGDPLSKYAVSVGYYNSCVIDDIGLYCWGDEEFSLLQGGDLSSRINVGETQSGRIRDVTQISVSGRGRGACMLATGRPLQTYNGYGSGYTFYPDRKDSVVCVQKISSSYQEFVVEADSPLFVSVGDSISDASYLSKNGNGLFSSRQKKQTGDQLWTWANQNYLSENPTQVSGNCFIDELGVLCNNDFYSRKRVKYISGPPKVISYGGVEGSCGIDDSGLFCWGRAYNSGCPECAVRYSNARSTIPLLQEPDAISSTKNFACAIAGSEVHCWSHEGNETVRACNASGYFCVNTSGPLTPPKLINPRAISVGGYNACAIDDTGIVCWGFSGFNNAGLDVLPQDDLLFSQSFQAPDVDGDSILNIADNCPNTSNADQADLDSDGIGDACDTDVDGDSVEDTSDNCPLVANQDQLDVDGDLIGDACDDLVDNDADGIANDLDNCPAVPNTDQADNDSDLQGDACDLDDDNDGVEDTVDNCSLTANEDQGDNDNDNIGDVCDSDDDNDAVEDLADNCPLIANVSQDDNDGDGFGDVCDPDDDNDAVEDLADNCPLSFNPDQLNTDGVGAGDACNDAFDVDDDDWENDYDNCPDVANRNQSDFDYDNIGDACDTDVDGDSAANAADACELTPLGELVGSIGCSIEQLCPCDGPRQSTEPWKNHGKYVSCMTKAAHSFAADGVISDNGKSDLVNAAAQSSCGY